MRWIIAIMILFDGTYQLFGDPYSVNWTIFYNITIYGGLMAIIFYHAYKKADLLLGVFGLYFLILAVNMLSYIGLDRQEYLSQINEFSISIYSIMSIILLLTFVIYKRWVR